MGKEDRTIDMNQEKAHLLRRDTEWAATVSEGRDLERILSYWTDDAVVLPPGFPAVVGKAGLREYVKASLQIPGFKLTWTSSDVAFSPDGNLAYMFGRNAVTMNNQNGKPITTEGRGVTIWRRDVDGQWRCVVDIWNAEK